jgi:hypothetical protein
VAAERQASADNAANRSGPIDHISSCHHSSLAGDDLATPLLDYDHHRRHAALPRDQVRRETAADTIGYQAVDRPARSCNVWSRVIKVKSDSIACAASIRSNGSRWSQRILPAPSASADVMGSSSARS